MIKSVSSIWRRKSPAPIRNRRQKFLRAKGLGGHLRFEPLEDRLLLAADLGVYNDQTESLDFFDPQAAGITSVTTGSNHSAFTLLAEGESLVAEAEAAPDLVAFAKALDDAGVKFFGAFWCPFCADQKNLFDDGGKFLPYIEVSNPDRTLNQAGIDNDITSFPTWDFPDGNRVTGLQTLEQLSQLSGIAIPQSDQPFFAHIPDATVPIGSPLHLVVDAYHPNGDALTITTSVADPSLLSATVSEGNPSLLVTVQGFGDMVFELFEDKAPRPVGRVIELVESGFYDAANNDPAISFHRVIDNFVIQFGDPTGTGAGGSQLGNFDDQYHLDLQHNRTGVLSFAKSSDDTNDSQMFITEGPQRALDFNHSIVGQLIEGEAVRQAISNVSTGAGDRPEPAVRIDSMSIFDDHQNGLVMLKPLAGTGETDVTVTVTDTNGNSVSQVVRVTVVNDTFNSAPFLADIPTQTTTVNTPATFTLTAFDVEGDAVFFDAAKVGDVDYTFDINNDTGQVTVTPPQGFVGQMEILVGVRQVVPADTVDQFDTQRVVINVVGDAPASPAGVDLLPVSDTGFSDSDGITNATTLQFQVTGVASGALVRLKANGTEIGVGTATGNSITITTDNLTALGDGTYTITATQTVNELESAPSSGIQVVLDTTPPTGFLTEPPTQVNAGIDLNYDVGHEEEGTTGFRYSLTDAPTGATINNTTGVVSWTPTASQIGSHVFHVMATDAAGNTASQTVDIDVIGEILVNMRLETSDLDGNPITAVVVGEEFLLQVFVEDARGFFAEGVFAAYLDVLAQSGLVTPAGANPITHSSLYSVNATGNIPSSGVIDELGGSSQSTSPLGPDEQFLASVRFQATTVGTEIFVGEPADNFPSSDTLLFGRNTAVPTSQINYGTATLAIVLGFGANDDVFNFDEDSVDNFLDVLANDLTPDGGPLTITEVSTPVNGGTVTIASDGKGLFFTPLPGFSGEDFFTYTVTDSVGNTDSAEVFVQVHPIQRPPIANDDSEVVFAGSVNNFFDVLANDQAFHDGGQKVRVISLGTPSSGGTISIGSSGSHILYTPAAGFVGTETFTYTIDDGSSAENRTDTATVTVEVVPADGQPFAVNDSFTVQQGAALADFDVLANDLPAFPDDVLTIKSVGTPSQGGQVAISSDNLRLQYMPDPSFVGTETVTYTIDDGFGGSATATVTFTVQAANDDVDPPVGAPPVANNDTLSVVTNSTNNILDVLANDTGTGLTITNVATPNQGGNVTIANNGTRVSYTPASGFLGDETFTYTITDNQGRTATATATVQVREFTTRVIGGTITNGTAGFGLGGIPLTLSGTDMFGTSVLRNGVSAADGSFSFHDVAPGDYTVSHEPLPFLYSTTGEVEINSAETDSDSLNNTLEQPTRRAEFIGLRDFLGKTPREGVTAALVPGGSQAWYQLLGNGWDGVTNLELQLSSDLTTVVVRGTQNGVQVQTTLSAANGNRIELLGQENNHHLVRIAGSAAELNFQPVSTSASAQGLAAEGEADPDVAAMIGFASAASSTTSNGLPAPEGEHVDFAVSTFDPVSSPATVFTHVATPPQATLSSSPASTVTNHEAALASLSVANDAAALSPIAFFTGSRLAQHREAVAAASLQGLGTSLVGNNVDRALADVESSGEADWRFDASSEPTTGNISDDHERAVDEALADATLLTQIGAS